MSALPSLRQSLLPDLSELFAGFPPIALPRNRFMHVMRLEDEMKDGRNEVRAELPGIDPSTDVDITMREGHLTIKAERCEEKDFDGRSEFSYGSYSRTVPLPVGADEDDVTASYDKGILTVSVAVTEPTASEKHVPVASLN